MGNNVDYNEFRGQVQGLAKELLWWMTRDRNAASSEDDLTVVDKAIGMASHFLRQVDAEAEKAYPGKQDLHSRVAGAAPATEMRQYRWRRKDIHPEEGAQLLTVVIGDFGEVRIESLRKNMYWNGTQYYQEQVGRKSPFLDYMTHWMYWQEFVAMLGRLPVVNADKG